MKSQKKVVEKSNERYEVAIKDLLIIFEKENIPKEIATLTNPTFDIPCNKYSLRNRLIILSNGTADARGYKQWIQVKRMVKKGTKSFSILSPSILKIEETDKNGNIIKKDLLKGFRGTPIFRVEDTEGEPLDYEKLELPHFNFMEVAERFGLKVKAIGFSGGYYGSYSPSRKEILMASPEEMVFYHELAHSGHDRVKLLSKRTTKQKEIVAEFVACVLAYIEGKEARIGNSYEYLKHYAGEVKVEKAVLNLIGDIEKVLNIILNTAKEIENEKVVAI